MQDLGLPSCEYVLKPSFYFLAKLHSYTDSNRDADCNDCARRNEYFLRIIAATFDSVFDWIFVGGRGPNFSATIRFRIALIAIGARRERVR